MLYERIALCCGSSLFADALPIGGIATLAETEAVTEAETEAATEAEHKASSIAFVVGALLLLLLLLLGTLFLAACCTWCLVLCSEQLLLCFSPPSPPSPAMLADLMRSLAAPNSCAQIKERKRTAN